MNHEDDDESLSADGDHRQDSLSVSVMSESAAYSAGTAQNREAEEERKSLARSETRAVRCLRAVTLIVLVVTATIVSFGVYFIMASNQRIAYETAFEAYGDKVIESFHTSVERFLGSFDSLSASITSYALESQSNFPNVTIPDFEVKAGATRILAQSTFVMYMPLVTDDTRRQWESYAATQQHYLFPSYAKETALKAIQDAKYGYVDPPQDVSEQGQDEQADPNDDTNKNEKDEDTSTNDETNTNTSTSTTNGTARDIQGGDDNARTRSNIFPPGGGNRHQRALQLESLPDQTYREEIWGTSGIGLTEEEGSGPYLPLWQASPVLPLINLLNLNLRDLSFVRGPFDQTTSNGQASFGVMTHLNDPTDENQESAAVFSAFLAHGQYRHEVSEYIKDPLTVMSYPVFETLSGGDQRKVVGVLGTSLYWRLLFTEILPPSVSGLIVVVSNCFNQSESFQIDGPAVTYLGSGKLYEEDFEDDALSANIAAYVTNRAGPQSRSYTAVDLNSGCISYDIRVYPSKRLKSLYINYEPLYFGVGVATIFVFTTAVFMFYNCLVERRQTIVLDTAVKSSAVVRSLFPANVRERLFAVAEKPPVHADSTNKSVSADNPSSTPATPEQSRKTSSGQQRANLNQRSSDGEWSNTTQTERRLSRFLSSGELGVRTALSTIKAAPPIADLFPEATVFFADLAGFTKWSSDRTPVEVFGLLETIYATFDAVATRRGVFKVETIGTWLTTEKGNIFLYGGNVVLTFY